MKQSQGFNGIMFGGAAVLMAIQPVVAAPAQVTGVQLNPTNSGVELFLQTRPGDRPQVFAVNRSNSWTADITSTQLRLPSGNAFSRENPAPGISKVTVAPLNANSVRVTVVGHKGAPVGQVLRPSQGGVLLSLSPVGGKSGQTPAAPTTLPSVTLPPRSAPAPIVQVPPQAAPVPSVIAQAPPPSTPAPVGAPPAGAAPLVPNPKIQIQNMQTGVSVPNNPPLPALPRAIAPPVGDIAISQFNPAANVVDLGTAERVPRLVLRDAPAREVLSLLARAAGLNLAYAPPSATGPQAGGQAGAQAQPGQPGAAADEGPKVTLDIENEAVQDVFNTVLQITGLEANRVGRTIYVGPRLPDDARNVITRTLRLNQATATTAANFLVSQGAELQIPITRVTIATLGSGNNAQNTRIEEPDVKVIKAQRGDAPLPLSGLAVSVDNRLNAIVISGLPRKVEVASAILSQLDARRRQVTVNVRVVDINLSNIERAGLSFSFGVGANRIINQGGLAVLNFGRTAPATPFGLTPETVGISPVPSVQFPRDFDFASNFFAQLQAQIISGNAKILTDPTLVVQEGERATVQLTEQVLTRVRTERTGSGDNVTVTFTTELRDVGVILPVEVDRIDDNGFITLAINPTISAPSGTTTLNLGGNTVTLTLVQERTLASGRIRLRDGQTLVAAGIIQDRDLATVRKIPILGDIPLLGALFRRTERDNSRREVIVVVTPRILDDSDRSSFGYNYTPGPGVRQILEQPR